jgi:hypothetical protein
MKARKTIDGPFVPHRLALLESYAWRALSREAHLALHRIEIEHLRHGGKENGALVVPYDHFLTYVGGNRRGIAEPFVMWKRSGCSASPADEAATANSKRRANTV